MCDDCEEKDGPHPHHGNMMLYARDAMETDKPWERWQARKVHKPKGDWWDCKEHPKWKPDNEYRRKPRMYRIEGNVSEGIIKAALRLRLQWTRGKPMDPDDVFSVACALYEMKEND